jgi:tetratricopeptide (TPR) repeat protein
MRHANREAADYLNAALEQYDRATAGGVEVSALAVDHDTLIENLAQARQRLGEYAAATSLWERARTVAEKAGNRARLAAIERRIGLGAYWSGKYRAALTHFDTALAAAQDAKDESLQARIRVARAMSMHALGQPDEARAEVDEALAIARRLGDAGVLARVHRTSLILHIFIGPAERAHADGLRAIEQAQLAGELGVAWSAHWAMAMVGGLTGNGAAMADHLAAGQRLAEELGSPVMRCWTSEIAIEYASGTGDWDAGRFHWRAHSGSECCCRDCWYGRR